MKRKLPFLALLVLAIIVFFSCHKMQKPVEKMAAMPVQNLNASSASAYAPGIPAFNPSVGRLFPGDTGRAWIAAYNQMYPDFTTKSCLFYTIDLQSILKYASCTGISFSNVSFSDGWGLLAYGVDATGAVIQTDSVPTSEGFVSWLKAESLRQRYIYDNPYSIYSEFFGSDMLNTFFRTADMRQVMIRKGWNSKGERMVILNPNGTGAGDVILDDGYPCGQKGCQVQ